LKHCQKPGAIHSITEINASFLWLRGEANNWNPEMHSLKNDPNMPPARFEARPQGPLRATASMDPNLWAAIHRARHTNKRTLAGVCSDFSLDISLILGQN